MTEFIKKEPGRDGRDPGRGARDTRSAGPGAVQNANSRNTRGYGGRSRYPSKASPTPSHSSHRVVRHTAKFSRMGSGKRREAVIEHKIPELKDNIRIIHLGGVEEVGKNMSLLEYKDTIVVIDCGFQFTEDSTPGIDYILPNTKYLEERKHKIKAVFITHGHLDHIGGIPYIMDRLGNPPIYTRQFTGLMIKKRQEEFPHSPALDLRIVEKGERLPMGDLKVSFFAVSHSIPDAMGIIIETPYGDIVHTGDLRLDHLESEVSEIERDVYEEFKNRNVLLLMTDSTNAENPGFSISERLVEQNIDTIIRDTKGRLIISTYASQVERMLKMIEICEKYGKKVVVDGRSMKTNIEVTKAAGLLHVKPGTLITVEEMANYPENKTVALVTGAQGEEFAALMRISNKTHKYIRLSPRDTILMSSSIVPGNERSVQKLKDNISRQGVHIIHYKTSDIHSSGHANSEELAWIHQKVHPKFFIPVHGYHYMHRVHADIAMRAIPEENIIIPDNGMIIEIVDKGQKMQALKETAPKNIIMVDGFSVGDIQEVVIRDRQTLAQDGIFVVVASIDSSNGKLRKSPDIISRGFVYLKESQELLHQTRSLVRKTIEDSTAGMNPINFDFVKGNVTDAVERFLFQKTAKRPIVIPVLIGV
ncbi:MAG: ribonuclease J [Patescibacteria group bacterium]